MKGSPGWKKSPDSVDGRWKQQLLVWLAGLFGIRTLIETGTCEAATPLAVHKHFDEIYTVELSDEYHERSRRNIEKWGLSNVRLYKGDSAPWLRDLLPRIPPETPLLFWLDGHGSGSGTADGGEGLPLELAAIDEYCANPLVVIDDEWSADMVWLPPYGINLDHWVKEYRTGEIIMHKGQYHIPPFEDA